MLFPSSQLIDFNGIKTNKIEQDMINRQKMFNIKTVVCHYLHDENEAHKNIQEISMLVCKDLQKTNFKSKSTLYRLFSCYGN